MSENNEKNPIQNLAALAEHLMMLSDQMIKQGELIGNLQTYIGKVYDHIAAQREETRHTKHAMETVVRWVGEELGQDAVDRLNQMIQQDATGETDGIRKQ